MSTIVAVQSLNELASFNMKLLDLNSLITNEYNWEGLEDAFTFGEYICTVGMVAVWKLTRGPKANSGLYNKTLTLTIEQQGAYALVEGALLTAREVLQGDSQSLEILEESMEYAVNEFYDKLVEAAEAIEGVEEVEKEV